jgi:hypothetical protein
MIFGLSRFAAAAMALVSLAAPASLADAPKR